MTKKTNSLCDSCANEGNCDKGLPQMGDFDGGKPHNPVEIIEVEEIHMCSQYVSKEKI